MPPQTRNYHSPPSAADIVEKLIDASIVIDRRMGLKAAEEKRVDEAFTLLAKGTLPSDSKGSKQRRVYLDFLQRVEKVVGLSKVVLCAAGLGPSAVAAMKDRVRVDLPFNMKEQEKALENSILQSLAETYSAQCKINTFSLQSKGGNRWPGLPPEVCSTVVTLPNNVNGQSPSTGSKLRGSRVSSKLIGNSLFDYAKQSANRESNSRSR